MARTVFGPCSVFGCVRGRTPWVKNDPLSPPSPRLSGPGWRAGAPDGSRDAPEQGPSQCERGGGETHARNAGSAPSPLTAHRHDSLRTATRHDRDGPPSLHVLVSTNERRCNSQVRGAAAESRALLGAGWEWPARRRGLRARQDLCTGVAGGQLMTEQPLAKSRSSEDQATSEDCPHARRRCSKQHVLYVRRTVERSTVQGTFARQPEYLRVAPTHSHTGGAVMWPRAANSIQNRYASAPAKCSLDNTFPPHTSIWDADDQP